MGGGGEGGNLYQAINLLTSNRCTDGTHRILILYSYKQTQYTTYTHTFNGSHLILYILWLTHIRNLYSVHYHSYDTHLTHTEYKSV